MKPLLIVVPLLALVIALGACDRTEPTPPPPQVLELGEEVFQRTAGGTGCQACHGADARGIRGVAPNISGSSAGSIRSALDRVSQMRHITLDDEEIEAVAAYIRTLR